MKTCTLCKVAKSLAEFPKQRNQKDGHSCWCKLCHCAKSKAWRLANPEKARETMNAYRVRNPANHRKGSLRREYGMELDEYDALLIAQDGKCAICGAVESGGPKAFLCVDHIAGTLNVRGLLCSQCNWGLGAFRHNPTFLAGAITYLAQPIVFTGTRVPQGVHRERV